MDWSTGQVTFDIAWTPAGILVTLLAVFAAGWANERRLARRRRTMQRLYRFGEQLISCRSSAESLRLLESALPGLLGVTEVRVYLPDRTSGSVQRLDLDTSTAVATPVLSEEYVQFRRRGAELCLRNHSLLAVEDTYHSPLFDPAQALETPRSMIFVPMFALENLLGVLAVGDSRRARDYSEDERAVLQHLGNQIAIGIRLREQRSLHEQTARSSRLEPFCHLVTAAAGELKQPLVRISALAQSLAGCSLANGLGPDVRAIAAEAGVAAGMLMRVLRFAGLHREQEGLVDLGLVLRGLLNSRHEIWQERRPAVRDLVSEERLVVAAPPGVMEQLLSSLLQHAEDKLEELHGRPLTIRALPLGSMAQVDFSWPNAPAGEAADDPLDQGDSPSPDVLSLAVCRSLASAHGGHLKIAVDPEGNRRLELEMPLAKLEVLDTSLLPRVKGKRRAPMTLLVLEPDPAARQALIASLGDFGHRAVPAPSAGEAIQLAKRVAFSAFFCSAVPPGAAWQECYQEARGRIPSFVLLTQSHDTALTAVLPGEDVRTLALPSSREELGRLLQNLEVRLPAVRERIE